MGHELKVGNHTDADALLDGLRLEFAAHRDRPEEIEPLLDTPEQRATYLRLMAIGCQQVGEWEAALGHNAGFTCSSSQN